MSSAWAVAPRVAWPAEPVGVAQPARLRRRARTPPEPAAGSPEKHEAARCWSAVASSRSQLWPPAACRKSLHSAVRLSAHFRHADRADRVRHAPTLRDQHVHLAQLGNNLFGLVSLPHHGSVLLQLSRAILQGGPLQRGRITTAPISTTASFGVVPVVSTSTMR